MCNESPSNMFHRFMLKKKKNIYSQMLPSRDSLLINPLGWQKNVDAMYTSIEHLWVETTACHLPPSTHTHEISAVSRIHTMPIEIHPSLVNQQNRIANRHVRENDAGKTRSPIMGNSEKSSRLKVKCTKKSSRLKIHYESSHLRSSYQPVIWHHG